MRPRLQYLVANGQLVLASRRPSRFYRYRFLLIGVGILMAHGLAILAALHLPELWQ